MVAVDTVIGMMGNRLGVRQFLDTGAGAGLVAPLGVLATAASIVVGTTLASATILVCVDFHDERLDGGLELLLNV